MPRMARGEYLDPAEVQIVHAVQRCVRRAFLCGKDPLSGKSFEYRRAWIRQRLEFLASVFGIDCLTYTVLSNHLHLVLRSRPDVVAQWSDEEVARRWWRLFPQRREPDGSPVDPADHDLGMIVDNPARLEQIRGRLSDVSWWMRCTAENIARRANAEEGVTGRFWEGRFKAQLILDEASLLACAAYVDLNPVRASLAKTPEESQFTGAKDRIDDLRTRGEDKRGSATHGWERSRRRRMSGWMSPLEIKERVDEADADLETSGRRASQRGFLSLSLTRYLELLDWTGRQIRLGKRGAIPQHLGGILERIGLNSSTWCELVRRFGKVFKRAAGTAESMAAEATRRGQQYLQSPGAPLLAAAPD